MTIAAVTALTLAGCMVALWMVSLVLRDASIVDIFWSLGFVLVTWVAWWISGDGTARELGLAVAVSIWGLRLAGYLAWRNWGEPEDKRYQELRRRFDPGFWWKSLFIVFLLQGGLIWTVSLPIQRALAMPALDWIALDLVGIALFAIGLVFETVGDAQLARFKADPSNRGEVMDRGLWRYTRHPNYFGDFCVWWGLWSLALSAGAPLWTAIGPVVMTFLLLRVSGVALLESTIEERRPGYREYVERTSAFFPRRPIDP